MLFKVFAIPLDGAAQAFIQIEERFPTKNASSFFGAEILMANFVARLVKDNWLDVCAHHFAHAIDQIKNVDLDFVRKIKGVAG
jgi:hypothetical protein